MNNRLQNVQGRCRHTDSPSCGESINYDPLQTMPLAMAYVPWQQWQNVYEGCKGLENGTIFEELIFPFHCASHVCRNNNTRNTRQYMDYTNAGIHRTTDRMNRDNTGCGNRNRCNTGRSNCCERRCDSYEK